MRCIGGGAHREVFDDRTLSWSGFSKLWFVTTAARCAAALVPMHGRAFSGIAIDFVFPPSDSNARVSLGVDVAEVGV